jgi:two-component system alkaline phosphatase synthesis response regulator PhoP
MAARILVVDDEVQSSRVLRGYLEQGGMEVLTAHDGREALRLARQERPDLIILDLMLPEIDGMDFCRTPAPREQRAHHHAHPPGWKETDRVLGAGVGRR